MSYFGFEGGEGDGFGDLDNPLIGGLFASLEPEVNHVTRGLAYLPWQFNDSTNLRTFLQILLEEIQELEEAIYELTRQKSLSDATGFQLDIIGEQIGKRREGVTDDEEYRRLLRVQIALNSSEGQAQTVIDLWKYLLNTDTVQLKEEFPAGVRLYASGAIPDLNTLQLVSKTLPVTVKVGFVADSTGTPFCFEGGVGLGFSSVESPTSGGQWVSRIDI